jgi:hypothetical protein
LGAAWRGVGGRYGLNRLQNTIDDWTVWLTLGTKSSSNSSEAASSESSQAPHPSPTAPYGRTLKGGRPTGDPKSVSSINIFDRVLIQGSWKPSYTPTGVLRNTDKERGPTFWKVCWIKLHMSKIWYVKLLRRHCMPWSILFRLASGTNANTRPSHARLEGPDGGTRDNVGSSINL